MTKIFRFATVAMIVAVAHVTPASARPFGPDSRTGSVVQNSQATSEQAARCYGDRPYYDYDSSGWLDNEYHAGIDCRIAPRARY
jgi:hypothetical protein